MRKGRYNKPKKRKRYNTEHREEVNKIMQWYDKKVMEIKQADMLNQLPEGVSKDQLLKQASKELGEKLCEAEGLEAWMQ